MTSPTSELMRLPRAAALTVIAFAAGVGLGVVVAETDHRRWQSALGASGR